MEGGASWSVLLQARPSSDKADGGKRSGGNVSMPRELGDVLGGPKLQERGQREQ